MTYHLGMFCHVLGSFDQQTLNALITYDLLAYVSPKTFVIVYTSTPFA